MMNNRSLTEGYIVTFNLIVAEGKELVNLTPHNISDEESGFSAGPVRGKDLLRIQKTNIKHGTVMDSSIYSHIEEVYGEIPEERKDRLYIVSQRVAEALAIDPEYSNRKDFVYPINIQHEHVYKEMTDRYGKIVTDSKGDPIMNRIQKIKGCRGFEFPRRPRGLQDGKN